LIRPPTGRIFVATGATDLRKSFDGLSAIVAGAFERDVHGGDVFVFVNRRATQVRVLYWERDGYCIWMKRLEAGTFRHVRDAEGYGHVEMDAGELSMLLEGIDASIIKRRKRYRVVAEETCNPDPSC
jgi:transposase